MLFVFVMIIVMIIIMIIKAKLRVSEFEKVIDIFESSDNINVINKNIDDYIYNYESRSKQNFIHTIINILINRKRNESISSMKEKLLNSDNQITFEIVEVEIENIDNDISHYRNDLYHKYNQICIDISMNNV
jgi:hypothetical protein